MLLSDKIWKISFLSLIKQVLMRCIQKVLQLNLYILRLKWTISEMLIISWYPTHLFQQVFHWSKHFWNSEITLEI